MRSSGAVDFDAGRNMSMCSDPFIARVMSNEYHGSQAASFNYSRKQFNFGRPISDSRPYGQFSSGSDVFMKSSSHGFGSIVHEQTRYPTMPNYHCWKSS